MDKQLQMVHQVDLLRMRRLQIRNVHEEAELQVREVRNTERFGN
jgi:hypothetical protein